jgi:pyrroloquinoline quinone (PQQ) biosynthesis protein C
LSDLNVLNRLAHMVAFEMHAGEIVESIWNALKSLYPDINNKDLLYFNIHVGGDDPAEAYHVDMTIRLLADIVSPDDKEEFLSKFKAAYGLHIDWCNKLVRAN